ncbi:MAG TPA: hypothetical protein VGD69_12505 [Herpetosiphonaceae bacterium]
MRKLRRVFLLMLCACCLSACTATQPFTTQQVVGSIPNDTPESEVIKAPATAAVNQTITLTVNTYGSSSCTTPDGARVEVNGLTATITPLDRIPRGDVACTSDLAARPHTVEVTFAEAGEAVIRVIGQGFENAQTVKEQRITITQ